MLEPTMTGQQGQGAGGGAPGADPTADPTADPGAAGGGAAPEEALTNRQLIDRLVGARGGNETGVSDEQRRNIEQETRNFIGDVSEEFREEFPEATNLQRQQFIEGMLNIDAGMILKSIVSAVKTAQEQEAKADDGPKPLSVQKGGSGKSTENQPRSLNEAVFNLAGLFEG